MVDTTSEIIVLSTTALQKVLEPLAAEFESATGCQVKLHFGPSGRMAKRVADGEATDIAIVTAAGIDELIEQGRLAAGIRVDVARSPIGLAVQQGAERPDISTVAGFRQTLLGAKTIAMSNPAGGAQSGAHLAKVFERLGIADELNAKTIHGPGGPAGLVGNFLLRKEAEIGLQQMPELMAVPGIEIIGPIPDEVQLLTTFSAGLSTGAANSIDAREWLRRLSSPEAAGLVRVCGMQPA